EHSNADILYHNEVSSLRRVGKHRNIPRLYCSEVSEEEGVARIVMQYIPHSDLESFLSECGPLDEEEALCVIAQMVKLRPPPIPLDNSPPVSLLLLSRKRLFLPSELDYPKRKIF